LQLTLPDRRRVHQLLERKVPIAEIARPQSASVCPRAD
jgi:transposase, IS30 family